MQVLPAFSGSKGVCVHSNVKLEQRTGMQVSALKALERLQWTLFRWLVVLTANTKGIVDYDKKFLRCLLHSV